MGRRRIEQDLAEQIPFLRRCARQLVGQGKVAEADDLVQDTLLKAIQSIDRFREGAELRAWLTTIMANTFRSERRREMVRRRHLERHDLVEPSIGPSQDDALEVKAVLDALAGLPPEQREVVALMAVEDIKYAEAAKMLNIKLGTFMSRIARGRSALRRMVEGKGAVPPAPRRAANGG